MLKYETIDLSLPSSIIFYFTISSSFITFSLPLSAISILIYRLIFLNFTKYHKVITWLQHLDDTFLGVPKVDPRKHLGILTPPNFLLTYIIRTLLPNQILKHFIIIVLRPSFLSFLCKCLWSLDNKLIF